MLFTRIHFFYVYKVRNVAIADTSASASGMQLQCQSLRASLGSICRSVYSYNVPLHLISLTQNELQGSHHYSDVVDCLYDVEWIDG